MFNKIRYIFLLMLFLQACEKEYITTETEEQFPPTVELVKTQFNGVVYDSSKKGIANCEIVSNYLTQQISKYSSATNGTFAIDDFAIHSNKSIIVFNKDGYSPNILTGTFQKDQDITQDVMLKKLTLEALLSGQEQNYAIGNAVKIKLESSIVTEDNISVKGQYINFKNEDKLLMLADQSEEGSINLQSMIWIDLQSENDKSVKWASNKSVHITIPQNEGVFSDQMYYFDMTKAMWVKDVKLALSAQNYEAIIAKPGFYGLLNGCDNDIIKPIPICLNNVTVMATSSTGIILHASDFDAGSFDNCDTDLDFNIRRSTDPCMNNSDQYAPTLTLCNADIGTNVIAEVKATDDKGNWDFCTIYINVVGSPCVNDLEKPIPYCHSTKEVFIDVAPILTAQSMNVFSYDNCSAADKLKYRIKKTEDLCLNGSTSYGDSIEFCNAEKGKQVEVSIEVTDENGNFDFVKSIIVVK